MSALLVVGLGRIGLPVALVAADCGFNVIGIDANLEHVKSLNENKTPFEEPGLLELLKKCINIMNCL